MQSLSSADPRLISFQALRKAVGWLGISLPPAMIIGNYVLDGCRFIQDSNSHYYYTVTGNMFVGILCAVGLFLFTYKGYTRTDNITSSLAGVCAICIAMFPTNDSSANKCSNVVNLPLSELRNTIHYCSAALFFILLAYISLFLFTKSKGLKTERKRKRNSVYRICGITILFSIVLIGLYSLFEKQIPGAAKYQPVFWLEWMALLAFGISWLVKGELVLKDRKNLPVQNHFEEIIKAKSQLTGSE
jgi:hypothetical protein